MKRTPAKEKKTPPAVKKASSNRPAKKAVKKVKGEEAQAISSAPVGSINDLLAQAQSAPMPAGIMPMLATITDKPFDDKEWIYEVKWDGYRALAYVNKGEVQLMSRNNKAFTEKYYPITAILSQWPFNAVIDGEILVLDSKGAAMFGALQNWRSEADGQLVLYVFDLLWYEGKNIMGLPLQDRRAILKQILPATDDRIRLSGSFDISGADFFAAAGKLGLEGIMAKKSSSLYIPGDRSKEWLKIKAHKRQEVVIGGFTVNEGTTKQFSSLLLGVYEQGQLQYAGKVGTGFSAKMQKEMMDIFRPLEVKKCPFSYVPDINKPSRFRPDPPQATATWLKPELVCEISFAEITADGVFRHPSFEGMRADKKATDVILEKETPVEELVKVAPVATKTDSKLVSAPKDKVRRTLLNPTEESQVKKIAGQELKFTNLGKEYWPGEGITKRDMFNYYYQVAEYILPYLKDRPLSLNRFPNGITGESFYQKDVKGKAPAWMKTFPYTTSQGDSKEFLVGTDEYSLLWMASLGCIEMNPWFSRVQSPDNPDYCIIDLDPDKNTFDQVIAAALEVKKVLDAMGITSYPKTSGSTGMHIYIPLAAKYTYDQSQLFGRLIVNLVHQQLPEYTSIERQIKNRDGKMYLDFLQNRPGATIACPYSLRPKPGATVSMPLHWDEVKPGLSMSDFTIHNSVARIRANGDIFKGVLGKGINLEKTLKLAKTLF